MRIDQVMFGAGRGNQERQLLTVTIQGGENVCGTSATGQTTEGRAKRTCAITHDCNREGDQKQEGWGWRWMPQVQFGALQSL